MNSGTFARKALRGLDRFAAAIGRASKNPATAITGERGEEEAYFYLRRMGYVMVARHFRSPRRRGEVDLVGWDKDVLCFIEVKTRSSRAVATAESAVDEEKQSELAGMAREYVRRLKQAPAVRFDVVSVYFEAGKPEDITLFKNAFTVS